MVIAKLNVEMPKNCRKCGFMFKERIRSIRGGCHITNKQVPLTALIYKRPKSCPLTLKIKGGKTHEQTSK